MALVALRQNVMIFFTQLGPAPGLRETAALHRKLRDGGNEHYSDLSRRAVLVSLLRI